MKKIFLIFLIIIAYCNSSAQSSHTFEIKEGSLCMMVSSSDLFRRDAL